MPLSSAARTPLVDQVIEQLRAQIVTAEWPVGTRIPTEAELSTSLGVGRNTVREAVRALAHLGLLESRQGSGTFVRAASELTGAVRRRLANAELRDILEVRRAFEVESARLAALRRTEGDLALIRLMLARREDAWRADDLPGFVEADASFHLVIARASHNSVLADLYADFGSAVRDSVHASFHDGALTPDAYVEHGSIVSAIAARDADAAANAAGHFLDEIHRDHPGD